MWPFVHETDSPYWKPIGWTLGILACAIPPLAFAVYAATAVTIVK